MAVKSSRAVMKRMGMFSLSVRTDCTNSKPSMSGIIMSDTIRSNTVSYMAS